MVHKYCRYISPRWKEYIRNDFPRIGKSIPGESSAWVKIQVRVP